MTAEEIFNQDGTMFAKTDIANIPSTIGYIKEFRLVWMATQLNTFVVVGETNQKIDLKTIDFFSAVAFQYALANSKGWPRGLQSGIGCIAILKGSDIDPAAEQFVSNLSRKHWSAFEIPVLYNTTQKRTIRYRSNPLWGMMYFPYFSKLIDKITAKF